MSTLTSRAEKRARALPPPITVTDRDFHRLSRCIELEAGDAVEALEAELSRARVVPSEQIPPDVVTMNSRLVFEDVATRGRRAITLVYPRDANTSEGCISVLAPIGSALLGLQVGDEVDRDLPGGRTTTLRVVAITFQPEAAGLHDL